MDLTREQVLQRHEELMAEWAQLHNNEQHAEAERVVQQMETLEGEHGLRWEITHAGDVKL
ncbi:MAG TPA: hypothetical protein VNU21_17120 [Usitatibacter sp.]|jgi:hypothetical protein|nr:hypothetical protein [Usitatibacter sp.]